MVLFDSKNLMEFENIQLSLGKFENQTKPDLNDLISSSASDAYFREFLHFKIRNKTMAHQFTVLGK
ncbi:hypothetical protein Hanom_Chr09g00858281 [Helianthus anomalus]